MTDGALPTPPTAIASPVSGTSPWKLYLAAAIGAFLLGLSDYFRNGSDSTAMVLNNGLVAPVAGFSLVPVILLATPFLGVIAAFWFNVTDLGIVIGLAMICVLAAAALGGIIIPLFLTRLGVDPAIASGPFVTTVTDVVAFASFLGIATLWFGLR